MPYVLCCCLFRFRVVGIVRNRRILFSCRGPPAPRDRSEDFRSKISYSSVTSVRAPYSSRMSIISLLPALLMLVRILSGSSLTVLDFMLPPVFLVGGGQGEMLDGGKRADTKKAGHFPIREIVGPTKNLLMKRTEKCPARHEDTIILCWYFFIHEQKS